MDETTQCNLTHHKGRFNQRLFCIFAMWVVGWGVVSVTVKFLVVGTVIIPSPSIISFLHENLKRLS